MRNSLLKPVLSVSMGFAALSTCFAAADAYGFSTNDAFIDLGGNTLVSSTLWEYGSTYLSQGNGSSSFSTYGSFSDGEAYLESMTEAHAGPGGGKHHLFWGHQYDFIVRNESTDVLYVSIDVSLYREGTLTADPGDYASMYLYGGMVNWSTGAYDFRTEFFDTSGGNVNYSNSISYGNRYAIQPGEEGSFAIWASTDLRAEAVPEPATMACLGLGALSLMRKRRAK